MLGAITRILSYCAVVNAAIDAVEVVSLAPTVNVPMLVPFFVNVKTIAAVAATSRTIPKELAANERARCAVNAKHTPLAFNKPAL
jgi:hypothetical protein